MTTTAEKLAGGRAKVTRAMERAWANWGAPVRNPDFQTAQFMRVAFMAGFAKGQRHAASLRSSGGDGE